MSHKTHHLGEQSNVQLDRMFVGHPHYLPATSKDRIPANLGGHFIIANLQNWKSGGGTHWVLLYDVKPNQIIYFDPMGEPPPTQIQNRMSQSHKTQVINHIDLQNINSSSCGWWSAYVADQLERGQSLKSIQSQFTNNPIKNESLLIHHFYHKS